MKTAIYISRDGKTLGRFSLEQLRALSSTGLLHEEDLTWTDGHSERLPLGQLLQSVRALERAGKLERRDGVTDDGGSFSPSPVQSGGGLAPSRTRKRSDLASPEETSLIREMCGWVSSGLHKEDAASLIEQLRQESLQGPITDEQLRQLTFYGLDFPRDICNQAGEQLIAEHLRRDPGSLKAYRAWTRHAGPAGRRSSKAQDEQ